ncbi:aminodeoxychorismate lyase [Bifidobacterium aquikefiricola]|uniref:Aminodeoxychorismate lyase n=1 Tax=Bifidobacterium aquikefiricola TaxID=3059038 RepID=A0AB39U8X8_9BIFI
MASIVLGIADSARLFGEGAQHSTEPLMTIVDAHERVVSPFDYAVTRGDGIFEATTVWHGTPISLQAHLRRLAHSAALMELPKPNVAEFSRAVDEMIAHYDDPEPGPILRILVSRGLDAETGIGRASDGLPHVWMFLDAQGALHDTDPITLTALNRGYSSDITSRAPWLLNGAKTLSYAVNMAMHRECDRRHVDDAVTTTEDGFVLECPNSSIVAQYGNRLVTPNPNIGILHGTSQRELFSFNQQEGGSWEYATLPFARLLEADHVFMTHGGWVIPVASIDDTKFVVNPDFVQRANDAIHSGRTQEEALQIQPDEGMF